MSDIHPANAIMGMGVEGRGGRGMMNLTVSLLSNMAAEAGVTGWAQDKNVCPLSPCQHCPLG
jgi:hypothetical protein